VLVKLLNSRLEVGSGLVLDETLATGASSVALTVDLTVDNVKTRLAGEVFQVLNGVSVSAAETTIPSVGLVDLPARQSMAKYVPASWSRTEAR
jgi:hypothetical protein